MDSTQLSMVLLSGIGGGVMRRLRPGVERVKRQEWIDEFLAKYRRGVMALKVLRWELEKTK